MSPTPWAAAGEPAAAPAGERVEQGAYLIHAPGIGGPRRIDQTLVAGLRQGGAVHDAEIFDWIADRVGLPALIGYEENRRQARLLAERIVEVADADPARPIVLTGHSGGTAIVVWALEEIPDVLADRAEEAKQRARALNPNAPPLDVLPAAWPDVRAVILVASALSPGYDLSSALSKVSGQAWSISSEHDDIVLGTGTSLFGTMDRQPVESAGRLGFYRPDDVPAEAYAKLREVPWTPAFAQMGNSGTHLGPMRIAFAREVLAPLVRETLNEAREESVAPTRDEGDATAEQSGKLGESYRLSGSVKTRAIPAERDVLPAVENVAPALKDVAPRVQGVAPSPRRRDATARPTATRDE